MSIFGSCLPVEDNVPMEQLVASETEGVKF